MTFPEVSESIYFALTIDDVDVDEDGHDGEEGYEEEDGHDDINGDGDNYGKDVDHDGQEGYEEDDRHDDNKGDGDNYSKDVDENGSDGDDNGLKGNDSLLVNLMMMVIVTPNPNDGQVKVTKRDIQVEDIGVSSIKHNLLVTVDG